MAYDGKLMSRALRQFEEDKRQREEDFRRRENELLRRIPRLAEIRDELRSTMAQIMSKALRKGADVERAIGAIREENLALQQERREILRSYGLTEEVLEYQSACRLCGDTGYTGDGICRCLKEYYIREQIAELSRMLDLGNQSFDTFDFRWYSYDIKSGGVTARENMELIYETCSNFAHKFGRHQDNLLLFGAPGLGKTFLSACIAREVSEKGFSVVYDTAGHIFSQFERQKFGREDEEAESDVSRVLNCDLLIMDDLGTELLTEFVRSALYQIINHRLQAKKCTIISSNFDPETLGSRYSPQIRSRLEGEYRQLPFFDEDIRRQKAEL
ncbi:MAG: ATP-binding protein [Oscillospiraceae bacterium]|nr:ATP-binding protein [Oscillospiraceae bacterium]